MKIILHGHSTFHNLTFLQKVDGNLDKVKHALQYILVVVKISWLITCGLNYFEILQEGIIFDISDERRTTKKLCPIRTLPCTSELNCRSKPQKLVSTGILLYGVCSTYSSTSHKISITILLCFIFNTYHQIYQRYFE